MTFHFAVATFIGMLIVLLLFLLIPCWIERYDPFSMRKYFQYGLSPDGGRGYE